MKLKIKKVTKKQFRKWGPLNQLNLASYVVGKKGVKIGIIGLLVSTIYFGTPYIISWYEKYEIKKTKKVLLEYRQNERWKQMAHTLLNVEEELKRVDWYNFYSAIYRLNNPESFRIFKKAEYYLNQIPSHSEFYNESIVLRTKLYLALEDRKKTFDKLNRLTKQLENEDNLSPEYFMIKLFHLDQSPVKEFNQKLLAEYNLLKSKYPDIFEHKSGEIEFYSDKDELIPLDIDKLSKIYGIGLAYAFELYDKNGLTKEVARDLVKMYPSPNHFGIAEMGMSRLHLNMGKGNKGQFFKFKQWIISMNFIDSKNNFTTVNPDSPKKKLFFTSIASR